MDESMKFGSFCDALEKICRSPKEKKIKNLYKLINTSRESSTSLGPSFFSLARLLLPKFDSERRTYGLKEHSLATTYIKILGLPKGGSDANKLLKFRSPAAGSSAGDFADVAYWVLKSRCRSGGILSVRDVNAHLDQVASLNASNKPRGVENELRALLFNTSPDEQKWLIRLILKEMRLGIPSATIFHAIHPDAKELYDATTNLKKVCEKLQDPNKRLHEIDVCLFEPCNPMLSERLDILKIESIMNKAPFYYVEKKHDGERFQVHIDNESFRYFSRNGVDFSDRFGESKRVGVLTPRLARQLHAAVKTCILDGEMLIWDTNHKWFLSKGTTGFDVKNLKEGGIYQPCFYVYDVLMLNGNVLTNKPFHNRIEVLKTIFEPLEGVFMITHQKRVEKSSEIVQALNEAIDNQDEGLIVKNPSSIYKPATRKGGWYKIKPEYTDGLTEELDLIIIGGYFGQGRGNVSFISHFLLGVAVTPESQGEDPTQFHSVGRVGSGYSKNELAGILEKLSPHWEKVKGGQMPHGLIWTKERPDLWIEPCNSLILQVKATEIVQTDQYKTGFTLRFPRVEKIRDDKKWSDCCTTSDFEKLRLSNSGKLASKHVTELSSAPQTKRQRVKEAPKVGQDYQAADLSGTAQKSSLLQGKEICVLSGNEKMTKQNLEKRIHELGGTVVQHRGPETFCVVAGKKDFRCKNLVDKGDVDVVTVDWLVHVLSGERKLEWEPQDLLGMSARTREDMGLKYDSFHDSYHNPTNIEALKWSLGKVSEQGSAVNLLPSEMGDLDVELFSGVNEFAVFRCCTAHFISSNKEEGDFTCSLLKAMFIFQGGRISDIETSDMTHVVIPVNDLASFDHFQSLNESRIKKFHLVTYDWIESCWASRRHLYEEDFHPRSQLYSSK